jgi:hypothetical protein
MVDLCLTVVVAGVLGVLLRPILSRQLEADRRWFIEEALVQLCRNHHRLYDCFFPLSVRVEMS